MVLFNYSTKELTAKIVYYGPGLCGKTTNLQYIYDNLPETINRGKMLSLATKTDRTLFFDFLPIDLGTIRGMRTRLQLYTVPGQVFYNTTRKLVLKGADGVVFVADSQKRMLDANLESLKNLDDNLAEHDMKLSDMPLIIQFNKRDLPDVMEVEELNAAINQYNAPIYEAVATTGIGVHETLKAITRLVLNALKERYADKREQRAEPPSRVAALAAARAAELQSASSRPVAVKAAEAAPPPAPPSFMPVTAQPEAAHAQPVALEEPLFELEPVGALEPTDSDSFDAAPAPAMVDEPILELLSDDEPALELAEDPEPVRAASSSSFEAATTDTDPFGQEAASWDAVDHDLAPVPSDESPIFDPVQLEEEADEPAPIAPAYRAEGRFEQDRANLEMDMSASEPIAAQAVVGRPAARPVVVAGMAAAAAGGSQEIDLPIRLAIGGHQIEFQLRISLDLQPAFPGGGAADRDDEARG